MLGNALINQVGLKNVYHLTDRIVAWKYNFKLFPYTVNIMGYYFLFL